MQITASVENSAKTSTTNAMREVAMTDRYAIGATLQHPYMVSFFIHDAEAVSPEQLEADMPRIMEAVRREHSSLLSYLEKAKRGI